MTDPEKTSEQEFIGRIESLDTGKLAALRRAAGARDVIDGRCPWLVGLVRGATTEAIALLVGSLVAQYSTADIRAGRHRLSGDFGRTWKKAIAGNNSKSIGRRFNILLESEFDPHTGEGDLPYRLRQMVRYAVSKKVGVDWPQLLNDLKNWNHPDKFVQKRWARSFFAVESSDDEQQPQNDQPENKE